jgi:hypothetical protein
LELDDYGGIEIHLSGGYRLEVFPDGRTGEQWRLFKRGTEAPHVVVEDGVLRNDEAEQKPGPIPDSHE